MKRIYLLAYITYIVLSLSASESAAWPRCLYSGAANDPSLVRLLNSDVRCRQWVDSVMQRLTLKERIGQLFIYTIGPPAGQGQQGTAA